MLKYLNDKIRKTETGKFDSYSGIGMASVPNRRGGSREMNRTDCTEILGKRGPVLEVWFNVLEAQGKMNDWAKWTDLRYVHLSIR